MPTSHDKPAHSRPVAARNPFSFSDTRPPRRAAPAVSHDGAWGMLAAATCGLATGICLGEVAFLIIRAGGL